MLTSGVGRYVVERIMEHADVVEGGRTERRYLLRWKGYDASHDSWEPEENLDLGLIESYAGG
jgi:hypothetical protein